MNSRITASSAADGVARPILGGPVIGQVSPSRRIRAEEAHLIANCRLAAVLINYFICYSVMAHF